MEQTYANVREHLYASLMAQSHLASYHETLITHGYTAGLPLLAMQFVMESLSGMDGLSETLAEFVRVSHRDGSLADPAFVEFRDILTLFSPDMASAIPCAGNDSLKGTAGNDFLDGWTGNDTLSGLEGNDTYRFGLGYGQDTIIETSGNDEILMNAGITREDLSFSASGNDLIITIGTGGDSLRIKDYYLSANNWVERIRFADGTEMKLNIGKTLTGGDGNDTITGTLANDTLDGVPETTC